MVILHLLSVAHILASGMRFTDHIDGEIQLVAADHWGAISGSSAARILIIHTILIKYLNIHEEIM